MAIFSGQGYITTPTFNHKPNKTTTNNNSFKTIRKMATIPAAIGDAGGDPVDTQLMIAKEHLMEFAMDHSHFTARWLTALKEKCGLNMDEATLAKFIVNILAIWLCVSDRADFTANLILVGVPVMLQFQYSEEKASDEDMLIYWPCYALVTLFDFILQTIPAWYSFKLVLFAMFFLRPWRVAEKIRLMLMARQVYMEFTQRMQSYSEALPPEELAQLLALAPPRSSPSQMPPDSLLVPQPAATTTARMDPAALPTTPTAVLSQNDQREPVAANTGSQERVDMNNKRSAYVDLKPRSKPKLVNPQKSMYADRR